MIPDPEIKPFDKHTWTANLRPEASRTAKSREGRPTPVASCTEWSSRPSPSHSRMTRAWLPDICLLGPPPFFHHLSHQPHNVSGNF